MCASVCTCVCASVVILTQSFVSLLDLADAKEAEFLAVDKVRKATL